MAIAFLLLYMAYCGLRVISSKNATYDEPHYLATGFYHWKTGRFDMAPFNPPLMRLISSAPLLLSGTLLPELPAEPLRNRSDVFLKYGMDFLYKNSIPSEKIIFWGRLPILLMTLLLAILVSLKARQLYGEHSAVLAAFLFVFLPPLLAHGTLATTDMGLTLFFFLGCLGFERFLKTPSWKNAAMSGLLLGLALGCKVSALALAVWMFGAIPLLAFRGRFSWARATRPGPVESFPGSAEDSRRSLEQAVRYGFILFLTTSLTISCLYGISEASFFLENVRNTLGIFAKERKTVGATFLLGEHSQTGFRHFYLLALLFKTPMPSLILFGWATLKRIKDKKIINFSEWAYILPAGILFAAASLSQTQIGLRYILPVYPAFILWASQAIPRARWLTATLVLWMGFSHLSISPHPLAYFNELAGGAKGGWRILVESDLDWGQDLKGLKKFMEKEKPDNLIFCYFGQASPKEEGLQGQNLLTPEFNERVLYKKGGRDFLAVSATYLQGLYLGDAHAFDWLKAEGPLAQVGYSIFVYDISANARAHENLGRMFLRVENPRAALREIRQAISLDPQSREALLDVARYFQTRKLYAQAQVVLREYESLK